MIVLANLTREDILGDMFYAGVLGYFAEYSALGHIMALQQRAGHTLAMGYGSYGYEPKVSYLFGIPRAIQPGGVVTNVRLGNYITSHTNDPQARIQLNQQLGMLSSALEHAIPEQMFTSPTNPGEAISAVKAIAKAQQAGQRIYHITQVNMDTALPNIHFDTNTMEEIRAALAVGKEVTTHTDPVSVPGYTGAGYIIIDPDTGIGAYKIGGGMNGGIISPVKNSGFMSAAAGGTANDPDIIPTPGIMLMGAFVVAAEESAAFSGLLLSSLGIAAGVVLGIALVILLIIVIAELVNVAKNQMEDFRQEVIVRAKANPMANDLPEDNCIVANVAVHEIFAPAGWARCTYACARSGNLHPRFLPYEIACPQPVPCAPGYIERPAPRSPLVDPIPLDASTCRFLP